VSRRLRLARPVRLAAGYGASALLAATLVWTRVAADPAVPEPVRLADMLGRRFLDRYMADDGRVVRHDQGGDTVSEGQAYAMLVAAGLGDRPRFDAAWRWTQANLQRADGLLAWLWRGGVVVDPMPASDADLDAAVALLEAADRFRDERYREDARRLAAAILAQETAVVAGRRFLAAGPWAATPPVRLNPSYFAPASFVALHGLTADPAWLELDRTSRQLVSSLTAAGDRLPPDWAELRGDGSATPVGRPGEPGSQPAYGLDAGRLLVRLAVDCNAEGPRMAAALWARLRSSAGEGTALSSALDGVPGQAGTHPTMHVASSAAARAAGDVASAERLLAQAVELDHRAPSYFGAAWLAVASRQLGDPPSGGCRP